jgi:hypothetical protein
MNVCRSNWNEVFPLIQKCVARADFVSIDFEMTGILSSTQLRNSLLDSVGSAC